MSEPTREEMLAALDTIGVRWMPDAEAGEGCASWITVTEPHGEEPADSLADALATMLRAAENDGTRAVAASPTPEATPPRTEIDNCSSMSNPGYKIADRLYPAVPAREASGAPAGAQTEEQEHQEKTENFPEPTGERSSRVERMLSAPDSFDPHPNYGPCDGFHRGQCSVCRDLLYTLVAGSPARTDDAREATVRVKHLLRRIVSCEGDSDVFGAVEDAAHFAQQALDALDAWPDSDAGSVVLAVDKGAERSDATAFSVDPIAVRSCTDSTCKALLASLTTDRDAARRGAASWQSHYFAMRTDRDALAARLHEVERERDALNDAAESLLRAWAEYPTDSPPVYGSISSLRAALRASPPTEAGS